MELAGSFALLNLVVADQADGAILKLKTAHTVASICVANFTVWAVNVRDAGTLKESDLCC